MDVEFPGFFKIRYQELYDLNGTYWSRIFTASPCGVIAQASARSWYPVVAAKVTLWPTENGWSISPVSTIPSDRVTLSSIRGIRFMPIPPRKVMMICGFIAWPLLWACTFMLQYEGRVPVGSGVAESGGRASDEEVAAVVTVTGVEAGVPDDRDSGWVQPAKTSASTRRSTRPGTSRRFIRERASRRYI